MNLELVALDVAGTTVKDDCVVLEAFKYAFHHVQPILWQENALKWTQYAIDTMGRSKIEVFTALLGDKELATKANSAFEDAYIRELTELGISPIAGSVELFKNLRENRIPVVLTTGFSRRTLDVILRELRWTDLIDFSVCPEEAGRGRPHPDMLIRAAKELGVKNSMNSLVAGDTASDMKAGSAFGARQIVGVLSGIHNKEILIESGATSVVNSVADISLLL